MARLKSSRGTNRGSKRSGDRGSSRGDRGAIRSDSRGFGFVRGIRMRYSFCRFCKDKSKQIIEYKSLNILEKMVNERGKILSRRITGNCAKHQRKIAAAIKRARFLSLIPYTK